MPQCVHCNDNATFFPWLFDPGHPESPFRGDRVQMELELGKMVLSTSSIMEKMSLALLERPSTELDINFGRDEGQFMPVILHRSEPGVL